MKMKILKQLLTSVSIIGILICATSCAEDFVETTPTLNLPGETVITDLASAESALIGLYSGLQFSRNYGGYDVFNTGLYSDELNHTGSFPTLAALNANDPIANSTEITNYWNIHYSAIYRANYIIEQVANPANEISEEAQARIAGQAIASRALLYYKLVKVFGGVPVTTDAFTAATDIDVNPIPRSSTSEVYNFILDDITTATNLLPDNLGIYFFNKNAARVLKAKIEMELGNYPSAESTLQPLLTAGYSLETDYESLFGSVAGRSSLVASSSETIFAIDYNEVDGNSHAFFFLDAGRGEVGPSSALINAFEDNDTRINLITANNEIGKYADAGNGSDDAYVFRFADVLLMQAELLARRDDPSASNFINLVRDRAGLGPVTLDSSNVIELIAQERLVEFFAESSDRFFTITRLGIADDVISNKPNVVYVPERNNLWPIPQQEIERNGAISLSDQNPGY